VRLKWRQGRAGALEVGVVRRSPPELDAEADREPIELAEIRGREPIPRAADEPDIGSESRHDL
jgi:hypothetical protein